MRIQLIPLFNVAARFEIEKKLKLLRGDLSFADRTFSECVRSSLTEFFRFLSIGFAVSGTGARFAGGFGLIP